MTRPLNQRAALVIRSLMRDLHVSNHFVYYVPGSEEFSARKILEQLESPHVGDGTPDAALAIGEHAFRAGFLAAVDFTQAEDEPITELSPVGEQALERAWNNYDPPEDIKALS